TDDQGQSLTRLTNSQSTILDNNDWNLRPTFSPDGKLIAFVSDKTSTFPTLWLMNSADGSGRHELATGLQEEGVDTLAWSPDGSQLAFTLFIEPGPTQIALLPLGATGRQVRRVLTDLPGGALDPAWAPDGSWLAFAGRDGGSGLTAGLELAPGGGLTRDADVIEPGGGLTRDADVIEPGGGLTRNADVIEPGLEAATDPRAKPVIGADRQRELVAARLSAERRRLFIVGALLSLAAPLLPYLTGAWETAWFALAAAPLPLAARALIFLVGFHVALAVVLLPLGYYGGFVLPRAYGLSRQSFR